MHTAFVNIDWQGRAVRIEHQWLNANLAEAPLLVFLHEGLGSLAMWRDFPQQLCNALGVRGLVYSRPGYGQSTRVMRTSTGHPTSCTDKPTKSCLRCFKP